MTNYDPKQIEVRINSVPVEGVHMDGDTVIVPVITSVDDVKTKDFDTEHPHEVQMDAARVNEIIKEIESEIRRVEVNRIIVTGKLNI